MQNKIQRSLLLLPIQRGRKEGGRGEIKQNEREKAGEEAKLYILRVEMTRRRRGRRRSKEECSIPIAMQLKSPRKPKVTAS